MYMKLELVSVLVQMKCYIIVNAQPFCFFCTDPSIWKIYKENEFLDHSHYVYY